MIKVQYLLLLPVTFFMFTACGENEEPKNEPVETQNVSTISSEDSEQYESYIAALDTMQLSSGTSLDYTRIDGASIQVEVFVDDSSKIVKLVEKYTRPGGGSIESKYFYYKEGKKYVTKEFYEEGEGNELGFVERVTYYNEKGAPKVSKRRKATFEDALVNEMFMMIDKYDCSDKRAYQVLNQEGEFATTFQGFVRDEHLTYLVVGENKKDGYVSTLVVQQKGPSINKLLQNERSMLGTPLEIDFQKAIGDLGYEFQALLSIKIL